MPLIFLYKTLSRQFYAPGRRWQDTFIEGKLWWSNNNLYSVHFLNPMTSIMIFPLYLIMLNISTIATQAWTYVMKEQWLKDCVRACWHRILSQKRFRIIDFYLNSIANVERKNVDLRYEQTDNTLFAKDLPRDFSQCLQSGGEIPLVRLYLILANNRKRNDQQCRDVVEKLKMRRMSRCVSSVRQDFL